MIEIFKAPETRRELQVRLTEATTNDDDLDALVSFLRDDLAYAPTNRSIIGSVLRECEFSRWQELMTEARWDTPPPAAYARDRVRELANELLREMERG